MLKDWDSCAREIGRALLRYDGHTTYAKLETILGIPASALFEENPSCYAAELISEVESKLKEARRSRAQQTEGRVAAHAHLRHAISLGFLERAVSASGIRGGGRKSKIDEATRIALSPLGRAYRSAVKIGDEKFRLFLVSGAVLDHDFDLYGLFIKSVRKQSSEKFDDFARQVKSLSKSRGEWLDKTIPANVAKERILNFALWRHKGDHNNRVRGEARHFSDTSIKHHFKLRKLWAKHLTHIDEDGAITDTGSEIAARVDSVVWLAPSPECVKKMGGVPGDGDISSAWDLLRPQIQESQPSEEMTQTVAEHMKSAFDSIRLRVFAQAPLAAVAPFVHFQEAQLGQRVGLRAVFDEVLRRYRNDFHCMLTATPEECYYQLRMLNPTHTK